jgi:hypothetical protein
LEPAETIEKSGFFDSFRRLQRLIEATTATFGGRSEATFGGRAESVDVK